MNFKNQILTAMMALAGLSTVASAGRVQYDSDEILVKLTPNYEAAFAAAKLANKVVEVERYPEIGWVRLKTQTGTTPTKAVNSFKRMSFIRGSERMQIGKWHDVPNDPMIGQQWHVDRINLPAAWDITSGDPAVVVAILDSGFQMDHPDMFGQFVSGRDTVDDDNDPTDSAGVGHGTHVAGITGAATNNAVGVAGVARDCKIMPIRVGDWGISVGDLVEGITWATNNGAVAMNMSLGFGAPSQALQDACNFATNQGVLVIASAGNDGNTAKNYPAAFPGVMAIASSDPDDSRSGFSTFGNWVHVAAPGSNILSHLMGSGYGEQSGTSMAAPVVTGLAGLVAARGGGNMNRQAIWDAITESCVPVPGNYVIFGRVDAEGAVNAARIIETTVLFAAQYSVFTGTHVAGGLSELESNDGNALVLQTNVVPRISSQGGVDLSFTLDRPASELFDFRLTFRAQSSTSSTAMIWIWNYATQNWDYKKAFPVKSVENGFVYDLGDDLGNYVDVNDTVLIRLRSHIPTSRSGGRTPYNFLVDQANLEASYEVQP